MDTREITDGSCKPCPFCKSTRLRLRVLSDAAFIACCDCGAGGPYVCDIYVGSYPESQVIKEWNTRKRRAMP
jgi:hypothetical protein